MRLKRTYGSREVSSLTGLTARQLQWWDEKRLFQAAVATHRTAAGGFTERRYSPVDLLELLVLADLRRHGLSVQKIRSLLQVLRDRFGVRLFEAIGGGGPVTLLTDGKELFARTAGGEFFNLLRAPAQPLLVIGEQDHLRELSSKVQRPRKKASRPPKGRAKPDVRN